mgnify:CR=1 FL=1
MQADIVTLTMNPAVDSASEAEKVQHTHKIRTYGERYDPGGGGVNVARVLARLGSDVRACYLAGGATGSVLDELIDACGVPRETITITDHTRVSHSVFERASGREYRFVPEGPLIAEHEWRAALDRVTAMQCRYLVASGSLPRGVPDDFYVRLIETAGARGTKLILDSSGAALERAISRGGLHLVKPSQGEFEKLVGRKLHGWRDVGHAAQEMVRAGVSDMIVVSMGHNGAVMADDATIEHALPAKVEVRSAVGAGDSFVAGMTHGLAQGWDAGSAFRYGMAAGTAAVMTPGTDLCHKADVDDLFARPR